MSDGIVVKCPSCGQHIMVKSFPSGLFYLACPFFECDFPFYVMGPSIDVVVSAWNEGVLEYARARNGARHG
ncbi:hypothetical protein AAY81_04930 [Denitrobacterium detoxificans]|uniref:Uncharacterized protein n=1 Tax=Denitrobacterium detoxificans TaxID=79604 RepID=A0A172RXW8_9ACTN|nr:hypothetical protein AAY81_04930 [Denitrobacterium detoxificans]SEP03976.1 hypothetical protein SAMN02910314_01995 [Denitrobacterium detoxificans]